MLDKSEVQSTSTMITLGMVLLLLSQVPIMVGVQRQCIGCKTIDAHDFGRGSRH